jgi:hypothetical protein
MARSCFPSLVDKSGGFTCRLCAIAGARECRESAVGGSDLIAVADHQPLTPRSQAGPPMQPTPVGERRERLLSADAYSLNCCSITCQTLGRTACQPASQVRQQLPMAGPSVAPGCRVCVSHLLSHFQKLGRARRQNGLWIHRENLDASLKSTARQDPVAPNSAKNRSAQVSRIRGCTGVYLVSVPD